MLCKAVGLAIELAFWTGRRWQPSDKHALAALDPQLAQMARAFYDAATDEQRRPLAAAIVERATGIAGGTAAFEWETPLV